MTSGAPDRAATRRHLLIIGVANYQPGWGQIGPAVEAEVEKARSLFLDVLKFEPTTVHRITDTTETGIKQGVAAWSKSVRTSSSDLTVVYYTGHGVVESSFFYLVSSEIQQDGAATGLQLSNLIPLVFTGENHVLLILDTCHSNAASAQALEVGSRLREAMGGAARGYGLHIITSARSIENAKTKAFIDGLDDVIRGRKVGGSDNEFLAPDSLMEQVNVALAAARIGDDTQHAALSGSSEAVFRFFPNPAWEPRLRVGMDTHAAVAALTHIQRNAWQAHWSPRARGVALDTDARWLFTGRRFAARELSRWIQTTPGQTARIVTGPPGSGKSAVLARLVTLSDPAGRAAATRAGALRDISADELPEPGDVTAAIYARSKTVTDLALELAVALGADLRSGERDAEALARASAAARKDRTLLVIDALDETQNPEQVAAFLRSLADAAKELRLLVGLRSDATAPSWLIDQLGPRFTMMDLGASTYLETDDIRRYVEVSLRTSPSSPYVDPSQADYTTTVAHAVAARANRSFLVASATARALEARPGVIDKSELAKLPTVVGEVFEFDFELLTGSERGQVVAIFGALAFAQGRGLPRALWPHLANALGTTLFGDSDIAHWLQRAGYYVTTEADSGEPVVRLYHEEFARYLRRKVAASSNAEAGDDHVEGLLVDALRATVPRDDATGGPRWTDAMPYVRNCLPRHLRAAKRFDVLYALVLDDEWGAARMVRGDASPLLEDIDLAIQTAREETPPNIEMVARHCLAYATHMTVAPPIVIDVIAAAGQLNRAALIAGNIVYPLDRCQAFCLLAKRASTSNIQRAREYLAEAERSATGVRGGYRAMVSFWIAQAAIVLKERDVARRVADASLARSQAMAQRVLGDRGRGRTWWEDEDALASRLAPSEREQFPTTPDSQFPLPAAFMRLPHALFWSAMALREAGEDAGLARIRDIIATFERRDFNLPLQAAAVALDDDYFASLIPAKGDAWPSGPGGFLLGNLALALATVGREADASRLLDETRAHWQGLEPDDAFHPVFDDSAKRLAWTLALCGRFDEAFAHLQRISNPEERMRALLHITDVASSRGHTAVLTRSADLVPQLLAEAEKRLEGDAPLRWFDKGDLWRLRSWAAGILLAAGTIESALDMAERVCAEHIEPSEQTSLARPTRATEMAKHHDTTDVVLSDTRPAKQAISMLLRDGKWEEALGVARTVSLPTRTLLNVDIARHIFYTSTDSSAATILLDQLVAARCYDVSLVGDILALSWPIIGQTPRPPIAGLQAPNERDS